MKTVLKSWPKTKSLQVSDEFPGTGVFLDKQYCKFLNVLSIYLTYNTSNIINHLILKLNFFFIKEKV